MLKKVTNQSLNCINGMVEYMLQNTKPVDIKIKHDICGNLYSRYCRVPKDVVIVGALLKVPTLLIINGDCIVYDGQKTQRVTGYKMIQGQAYRQSAFRALEDTQLTMLATVQGCSTVQEAQKYITDQSMLLTNHRQELLEECQPQLQLVL